MGRAGSSLDCSRLASLEGSFKAILSPVNNNDKLSHVSLGLTLLRIFWMSKTRYLQKVGKSEKKTLNFFLTIETKQKYVEQLMNL